MRQVYIPPHRGALMGKLSREKGAKWERAVCKMFADAGISMARSLNETRDGNCGDVRGEVPIVAQCKVGQLPNPYQALREAVAAAGPGEHPVAIVRRNRGNGRAQVDMAVLPLDSFMELAATLKRERIW